jgi:hypothetical protein
VKDSNKIITHSLMFFHEAICYYSQKKEYING